MSTSGEYVIQNAASDALTSIDRFIGENDAALSVPLTTLNQGIATLIESNGRAIKTLTGRLVKAINQRINTDDEVVDSVMTTLLQGIDAWLSSQDFLLTQMASKGGLTQVGDPLSAALLEDAAEGKQLAYQGTLVLAVKEAVPYLEQLIEVLREIRDRMPEQPVQFHGEPPADDEDTVVEVGNQPAPADDEPQVFGQW